MIKMEGSFQLPVVSDSPTVASPTTAEQKQPVQEEKKPYIFGFFDIHASLGINWTKPQRGALRTDFGTDYDFGLTFMHLPYTNSSGPGLTLEEHFDYSRQNFDGMNDWKFRRTEVYTRIRPISGHAAYPTHFNRVYEIILTGLYVDLGYSNATYFQKNLMEGRLEPDYHDRGFFWGWGMNIKWREDRIGFMGGIGSRWYTVDESKMKYKTRCMSLGVTYNIVWKD
jgi:hypothetical protein